MSEYAVIVQNDESAWDDIKGDLYHYPSTYQTILTPGCKIIYYKGRMTDHRHAAERLSGDLVFVPADPQELLQPQKTTAAKDHAIDIEDVPESLICQVFEVMQQAHWHQFQILTKRSQRLRELAPTLSWPENVWMGVTVENDQCRFRLQDLRAVPASTRFLSLEPLLGPIADLDLTGIHWVIVGGESGPGARPMQKGWVRDIRDQCAAQGVRFFFKQWGGINKKKAGRILDGRIWDQMPAGRQSVLARQAPLRKKLSRNVGISPNLERIRQEMACAQADLRC